jgi:hypothetical protein
MSIENSKILWATGLNNTYYNLVFEKVIHTWNLLPGDVRVYMDDVVPGLKHDFRAVPSNLDQSTVPLNLSGNEIKFWRKSRSIVSAIKDSIGNYDYCVWLDADVSVIKSPILADILPGVDEILSVNNKIVTRNPIEHLNKFDYDSGIDTGFIGFNLNHPQLKEWLEQYEQYWYTDKMEKFPRKYDTFVLETIVKDNGYKWNNLWYGVRTHGKFYCGFEDSNLEKYFYHHWGRKQKDNLVI